MNAMNAAAAAIAKHLNVAESAIVRVEEWANVLFAVVTGIGARFVSKKVVHVEDSTVNQEQLIEKMEEVGGRRWTKGDYDRMYFHGALVAELLKLSNSKARKINAAKFYYDLNTNQFVQGCNTQCWHVTDKKFGHKQPYWAEAIAAAVGL